MPNPQLPENKNADEQTHVSKSNKALTRLGVVAIVAIVYIVLFPSLRDSLGVWTQGGSAENSRKLQRAPISTFAPTTQDPVERERILRESEDRVPGEEQTFDGVEFVWIPAGSYMRGSGLSAEEVWKRFDPVQESDAWFRVEHPQHSIDLTLGFWLAKYEVTRAQFERFTETTGYRTDAERIGTSIGYDESFEYHERQFNQSWKDPGPGMPLEGEHPVTHITWNDAIAYLNWMSAESDGSYRLPTEAEWEYACRAGSTTVFPWGDEPAEGKGWLNGSDRTPRPNGLVDSSAFPWDDGFWSTAPVGSFRANAWGVHDMLGNVSEWCSDWRNNYADEALVDPWGPETSRAGRFKVIRGGSWHHGAGFCRAAHRFESLQHIRSSFYGMRVVRNP